MSDDRIPRYSDPLLSLLEDGQFEELQLIQDAGDELVEDALLLIDKEENELVLEDL